MSTVPYQRSYRRVRPKRQTYAAGYLPNPAAHLTDHGADPDPADLAWCIRRRWRVIYDSARYAAGQPLWRARRISKPAWPRCSFCSAAASTRFHRGMRHQPSDRRMVRSMCAKIVSVNSPAVSSAPPRFDRRDWLG